MDSSDFSTYVLLIPPKPNGENTKLEMMHLQQFMDVMCEYKMVRNNETNTQSTQVDIKCELVTQESQTVRNTKDFCCNYSVQSSAVATSTEKNVQEIACNTEIKISAEIGVNTIDENVVFNKRANVVLPVQRFTPQVSLGSQDLNKKGKVSLDEYRRRTSFEDKPDVNDNVENKRQENVFEAKMKFLECHMKRLQNLMKELGRRKAASGFTNFVTQYVDHITSTINNLSAENILEVMDHDKVAIETKFGNDVYWKFASDPANEQRRAEEENGTGDLWQTLSTALSTEPRDMSLSNKRSFSPATIDMEERSMSKRPNQRSSSVESRSATPVKDEPKRPSRPCLRNTSPQPRLRSSSNEKPNRPYHTRSRSPPIDLRNRPQSRDPRALANLRNRYRGNRNIPPPHYDKLKRKPNFNFVGNLSKSHSYARGQGEYRTPPMPNNRNNNTTSEHVLPINRNFRGQVFEKRDNRVGYYNSLEEQRLRICDERIKAACEY